MKSTKYLLSSLLLLSLLHAEPGDDTESTSSPKSSEQMDLKFFAGLEAGIDNSGLNIVLKGHNTAYQVDEIIGTSSIATLSLVGGADLGNDEKGIQLGLRYARGINGKHDVNNFMVQHLGLDFKGRYSFVARVSGTLGFGVSATVYTNSHKGKNAFLYNAQPLLGIGYFDGTNGVDVGYRLPVTFTKRFVHELGFNWNNASLTLGYKFFF